MSDWHPASAPPSESGKLVLAAQATSPRGWGGGWMCVAFYNHRLDKWQNNSSYSVIEPTHWMELPLPPGSSE